MMAKKKGVRRPKENSAETRMVATLDQLAQFQELQRDVLPALLEAARGGKTSEEIMAIVEPIAAARLGSMTLSGDERMAYQAIKEILDRRLGKATERREVTHRLDKLPEEELDAIIYSAIADLEEDEEETD